MLAGPVAAATERIRVGSGGVMEYGADEVIVVTINDHQARRRSCELITEAFGLSEPAARAA